MFGVLGSDPPIALSVLVPIDCYFMLFIVPLGWVAHAVTSGSFSQARHHHDLGGRQDLTNGIVSDPQRDCPCTGRVPPPASGIFK